MASDVLEEARDLLGDGLGVRSVLGIVGELVVTNFGIPWSAAIINVFDRFSVGRSCGLSTEIRDDLLDIPDDVNNRALVRISFEDIPSGGSLDNATTQANDVPSWAVFEDLLQDLRLCFAEGRPAILSDKLFDPDFVLLFEIMISIQERPFQGPGGELADICLSRTTHSADHD